MDYFTTMWTHMMSRFGENVNGDYLAKQTTNYLQYFSETSEEHTVYIVFCSLKQYVLATIELHGRCLHQLIQ